MKLAHISELHTGCLMLAEPFMDDTNFKRSVVLLTEYKEEGVIGFSLNQPSGFCLPDLLPEFDQEMYPVYTGGPVGQNTLHYIHVLGQYVEDSVDIGNGLYWSGNFETTRDLIFQNAITPQQIRFFMGYAGWGYQQLHDEIETFNSWVVSANPYTNILTHETQNLWKNLMKLKGKDYAEIANYPEHPSLN